MRSFFMTAGYTKLSFFALTTSLRYYTQIFLSKKAIDYQ
jgi:hypothetical protein